MEGRRAVVAAGGGARLRPRLDLRPPDLEWPAGLALVRDDADPDGGGAGDDHDQARHVRDLAELPSSAGADPRHPRARRRVRRTVPLWRRLGRQPRRDHPGWSGPDAAAEGGSLRGVRRTAGQAADHRRRRLPGRVLRDSQRPDVARVCAAAAGAVHHGRQRAAFTPAGGEVRRRLGDDRRRSRRTSRPGSPRSRTSATAWTTYWKAARSTATSPSTRRVTRSPAPLPSRTS